MMWYKNGVSDRDVILSTRARFARNIEDYPFDLSQMPKVRAELIQKVQSSCESVLQPTEMAKLTQVERLALCEEHVISPAFMDSGDGVLLSDRKQGVFLMTTEEDHIRLQVIGGGFVPKQVMETADRFVSLLDERLKLSYDEKWGYLTHCPTNLGGALRLSVMAFLPGIVTEKRISALSETLVGMGYHLRGMYGEGSKSSGCLYQISNRYSLGMTSDELLSSFISVVEKVIELERRCREHLSQDTLQDTAGRAYGALRYCCRISYDEFLTHYTHLRLAVCSVSDLPFDLDLLTLDRLLVGTAPGMLTKAYDCHGGKERDKARAKYIQSVLTEV